MKYTSFLFKKIYKNKLNVLPIMLFMGFLVFHFYISIRNEQRILNEFEQSAINTIERLTENIKNDQQIVDDEQRPLEYRIQVQKTLDIDRKEVESTQRKIDGLEKKNWAEYYRGEIGINEAKLARIETLPGHDYGKIYVIRDIEYAQHMLDYGNGFDSLFAGIQGVSYMLAVYRFFIALFLSICMIYITSRVYCTTNFDKMDIQRLLPISPFKRQCTRLSTGICVGLGTIACFSILAVLCGAFTNSLGNLHTPYMMYTVEGEFHFGSILDLVPQLLILMFLVVGFIANVTQCISLFFRKSMTCMLISLAVILGGLLILPQIIPMHEYLHLIPTTYISFFNVLTGEIAYNLQNVNVTFTNGVLVLMISNAVLMGVYFIVTRNRIKKV